LFSFDSVVSGLADKLLRRHPHVFADGEIEGIVDERSDSERVKHRWEAIKAQERAERAQHGALDDVPVALPALPRAQKLQKRAARVGFDWPDSAPVLAKLDEELAELREAMHRGDPDAMEDELGDLLFSVVNLARHLRLDAESALRRSSGKFERRFRAMEAQAGQRGQRFEELDSAAMELLWEQAKAST
jgi:ATP diphosphatase